MAKKDCCLDCDVEHCWQRCTLKYACDGCRPCKRFKSDSIEPTHKTRILAV